MKKIILLVISVSVMSGCAFLDPYADKAADRVASGVKKYCENVDPIYRQQFRDKVNEKLAPTNIVVDCK